MSGWTRHSFWTPPTAPYLIVWVLNRGKYCGLTLFRQINLVYQLCIHIFFYHRGQNQLSLEWSAVWIDPPISPLSIGAPGVKVDYTWKSPRFELWDEACKVRLSAWYGFIQIYRYGTKYTALPSECCTEWYHSFYNINNILIVYTVVIHSNWLITYSIMLIVPNHPVKLIAFPIIRW